MNTISIAGSCKEGDSSTVLTDINIEPIYNRHISTIYKICYMLLHNADDAEDAVQTVFMKLISVHPEFRIIEHYNLHEVSIKTSNAHPNITHTNFYTDYGLSAGTVELTVDCYKYSSDTNSNLEMGISTSQHADKASTYKSKNGTEFTLLEAGNDGESQTVANIMINPDNKQTYLYSIKFTNVTKADIENILDSFDMSI